MTFCMKTKDQGTRCISLWKRDTKSVYQGISKRQEHTCENMSREYLTTAGEHVDAGALPR